MSNDYNIRSIGGGQYEVHKWDDGDTPVTTYLVIARDGKLDCNCLSGKYRGYCKHKEMVKEYRRRERLSDVPLMMFFRR